MTPKSAREKLPDTVLSIEKDSLGCCPWSPEHRSVPEGSGNTEKELDSVDVPDPA